jgi:hypothetical protein
VLSPPEPLPTRGPLDEVERGPCKAALIEIHGFLTGELTALHHDLAQAAISKGYSLLTPYMRPFQIKASNAEIAAKSLEQRHALSLKRMGLDLSAIPNALRQLKTKIIRLDEGVRLGWPQSALKERVDPMHKQNLELGQLAKSLIKLVEDKQGEFFKE